MKAAVVALALLVSTLMPPQTLSPRERLSTLNLSAGERRQILAIVARSAYDTPDSWEEELLATRVDLGVSPGIVLRGTKLLCGGTGNCQLFVLRRVNGTWSSLFPDQEAPLADAFELGPGVTRGIKDLTVATNTSAEASQRVSFKFDGQMYRRTGR